ncbi:MAG: PfkB family carbohydrate kinase [bacterium]
MNNKGYILVIGSAHLDILAYYDKCEEKFIDKKGSFEYSIGGTAFNIAVNLARHSVPVCFYTALKKGSLATEFTIKRFKKNLINYDYVQIEELLPESGFIAHMAEKDLVSAVSCMGVESATLNAETLSKAVENSKFVVMECNLAPHQINVISKIALNYNKMIFMGGVSESKVKRAKNVYVTKDNPYPLELLSLSQKEAKVFLENYSDLDSVNICNQARAKNVLITKGDKGFSVYTMQGEKYDFDPPAVDDIKSTSGAGEALLAAICNYVYDNEKICWGDSSIIDLIHDYVREILSVYSATIDGSMRDKELNFEKEDDVLKKEFKLTDKINILIGIIIALGTIILVFITWR